MFLSLVGLCESAVSSPFFLPLRSPVFFFSCQSFSPFPVFYSVAMLSRLSTFTTFSTSTFFLFLLILFIKFSCFIFCFYVALSFSTSIWGLFSCSLACCSSFSAPNGHWSLTWVSFDYVLVVKVFSNWHHWFQFVFFLTTFREDCWKR